MACPLLISFRGNKKNYKGAYFQELVATSIKVDIKLPMKSDNGITEAIEHFNNCVQQSAWHATPENTNFDIHRWSLTIRLAEKRRARKLWQKTRYPSDKTRLFKHSSVQTTA